MSTSILAMNEAALSSCMCGNDQKALQILETAIRTFDSRAERAKKVTGSLDVPVRDYNLVGVELGAPLSLQQSLDLLSYREDQRSFYNKAFVLDEDPSFEDTYFLDESFKLLQAAIISYNRGVLIHRHARNGRDRFATEAKRSYESAYLILKKDPALLVTYPWLYVSILMNKMDLALLASCNASELESFRQLINYTIKVSRFTSVKIPKNEAFFFHILLVCQDKMLYAAAA